MLMIHLRRIIKNEISFGGEIKMSEKYYKIRVKKGIFEFEIQGDKEFIENYYDKIKNDLFRNNKNKIIDSLQEGHEVKISKFNLTEFYKVKRPQNHNEIILTIALWLLKNENIEELQPSKHILKNYDTIKLKKPSNVHQHIRDLKNDGLIMAGEQSGSYKLTLHGIEFVENELPKQVKK